jgi:hypothetical protein
VAVKSRAVTVADTATRLDTVSEADGRPGSSMAFYNNGTTPVYVGGSDVTTVNGAPVAAASWSPIFDVADDEGVYGIVSTGLTANARVLEVGV